MKLLRNLVFSICSIIGLAGMNALAGSYVITYSGGGPSAVVGPTGGTWNSAYSGASGSRGGGAAAADSPTGAIGPGSVTCSGTITAHFEWTPSTDPRPGAIVIKHTSWASASGNDNDCDDGLVHEDVNDGDGSDVSTGSTYELVNNPPARALTKLAARMPTARLITFAATLRWRAHLSPIRPPFMQRSRSVGH